MILLIEVIIRKIGMENITEIHLKEIDYAGENLMKVSQNVT
jgi:hypothetical protein